MAENIVDRLHSVDGFGNTAKSTRRLLVFT